MSVNSWRASPRNHKPAVLGQPIHESSAWYPKDFENNECWIYSLNDAEVGEVLDAADATQARGIELMDIRKDAFRLPTLAGPLADIRDELIFGRGFVLIRGLPVAGRTREQIARAFWGVGAHLGRAVSQNGRGQLLGHVTDLGGDYGKVRGYMTRAHMSFHADRSDFLALCCLHPAKSGGAHRICSSVTLYNEMLKSRPDLVQELTYRFYRFRSGELRPGETKPWYRQPVFSVTDGYFAARGASAAIAKMKQVAEIPPLTAAQEEAIALYKSTAATIALDINYQPGDISVVQNHVTLHSRSAFEDWPEVERKRHLLRLWLSTDGAYPVCEDIEKEIRGVTVEGTKLRASLEVA
ncbi:MAG: hypothetical protein RL477_1220 [Pseudomonadota bacterium]|jgi:hypothetical protein